MFLNLKQLYNKLIQTILEHITVIYLAFQVIFLALLFFLVYINTHEAISHHNLDRCLKIYYI